MDRIATELAIHRNYIWLLERFGSIDPVVLQAPVTQSLHDADFWWTPKDHFSHLVRSEDSFDGIVEAFLAGSDNPMVAAYPEIEHFHDDPESMHRYTNDSNDGWAHADHEFPLGTLVRQSEEALSRTFALLARCTDEQLASRGPNVPERWSGGTLGAVLAHNSGDHAARHWGWIEQGWKDLGR